MKELLQFLLSIFVSLWVVIILFLLLVYGLAYIVDMAG